MVNCKRVARASTLLLPVFLAASVSLARGQDFTLTVPAGLHTASVNPGGSSTASIDLEPVGTFDTPVALSCAVTSGPVTTSPPVCVVSPDSATPPAEPSLTVTTTDTIPAGTYQITITGVSGSITHSTAVALNVTPLTEDYTLSVLPTTATPSPVAAGSPATTTVTVSAIGSYSGHTVTLSCFSVTPIATGAPVCAFNPPGVLVTTGISPTSTLTITTFGTAVTTRNQSQPRMFYALWLVVPGLALVGVGVTGARRKRLLGLLLLMALASSVLLIPACNTTTTNGPNNEVTPDNTYVFTLSGADENGAGPSNSTATTTTGTTGTTGSTAATVTLEVKSP
jgi:hypothetical protein